MELFCFVGNRLWFKISARCNQPTNEQANKNLEGGKITFWVYFTYLTSKWKTTWMQNWKYKGYNSGISFGLLVECLIPTRFSTNYYWIIEVWKPVLFSRSKVWGLTNSHHLISKLIPHLYCCVYPPHTGFISPGIAHTISSRIFQNFTVYKAECISPCFPCFGSLESHKSCGRRILSPLFRERNPGSARLTDLI